jgi:hypothetical protein
MCAATVQQPRQIPSDAGKSTVRKMRLFAAILQALEMSSKASYFSDKEEVPGSSPGRPTTMSTFIPQTGSAAILSFTLIFAFPKVS